MGFGPQENGRPFALGTLTIGSITHLIPAGRRSLPGFTACYSERGPWARLLARAWQLPLCSMPSHLSAGTHPASSPVVASRSGLWLQAEVRGVSLQVSWDHAAAAIRNATSGSLTFHDGKTRKTLELSQTAARGVDAAGDRPSVAALGRRVSGGFGKTGFLRYHD